ncbi:MAG: hypothetical protein K8R68_08425 [Bacteroidales bacterium]|nr:hypothetical protein [Bacteroidales bacterium]
MEIIDQGLLEFENDKLTLDEMDNIYGGSCGGSTCNIRPDCGQDLGG